MQERLRNRTKSQLEQSARFHQQVLNPSGEAKDLEEIYREAEAATEIPLLHGLQLVVREARDMKNRDAFAIPRGENRLPAVHVRANVLEQSRQWLGRARWTLAHEIAHLVLHSGDIEYPRLHIEEARSKFAGVEKTAETQADYWTAAFTMPEPVVIDCKNVDELIRRCRMSRQAAEHRWKEVILDRQSRIVPSSVEDLLDRLRPQRTKTLLTSDIEKAWSNAPEVPGRNPNDWRLSVDLKVVRRDGFAQSDEGGWFMAGGQVYSWDAI